MALAAPIAPDAYASSTMGGKKSSVSTIATSGATRYTAASSLVARPTRSSAGPRCSLSGRRTCASGPGPSFAPQPAQVASVVSRTSSRVNIDRSLGARAGRAARDAQNLRKRGGRTDRREPHADGENDEQRREREIAEAVRADDHHREQDDRRDDERQIESEEERQRVQMTWCSLMSSPRAKRPYASELTSRDVLPSTITSPVAGACMIPWPEKPAAQRKPRIPSTAPRIGCLSGVSSYKPAQPVFTFAFSRIGNRARARSTIVGRKSQFTESSKPGRSAGSAIPNSTPPDSRWKYSDDSNSTVSGNSRSSPATGSVTKI